MYRHLLFASLTLALVSLLAAAGCSSNNGVGWLERQRNERAVAVDPKVPQLVALLNKNAERVPGFEATNVEIDAKKGGEGVTLIGLLACHKPRDFRLKARVGGQPMVDIGSNSDEFWYWIGKAPQGETPYVFHCRYADFERGNVWMPFPFQPDMVVAALGLATYDERKAYEVRQNPQQNTVELIEKVTVQGQPMTKATVFDLRAKSGDSPVIAHVLRDAKGQQVCVANVKATQRDAATGAVLPATVQLVCRGETPDGKPETVSLEIHLRNPKVVQHTQEDVARLFGRTELARFQGYDLGKRQVDRPIEPASGTGGP